jgi:putative intracellular protease/amidase
MSQIENAVRGLKVAILVENGFEQSEMTEPRKALEQAGSSNLSRTVDNS